jgi:hypothetical protein
MGVVPDDAAYPPRAQGRLALALMDGIVLLEGQDLTPSLLKLSSSINGQEWALLLNKSNGVSRIDQTKLL